MASSAIVLRECFAALFGGRHLRERRRSQNDEA
jgi:hypothetical protein